MTTKEEKKRKEQRAEESTERNGEKNAYIRSRNSYREEKKLRQNVQTEQLLTLEATELRWATQKR